MSDPFRLRVLKALTAALEEIKPCNGYQHDLTGKVFRGRIIFGDDDPVPMVSVLEAIEEKAAMQPPPEGHQQKESWELLVQGFLDEDRDNPTDPAYSLLADVKRRLIEVRNQKRTYNILGMGESVIDLRIGPGVVRPPDEVSSKAYFWLRVTLDLVENLNAPYD